MHTNGLNLSGALEDFLYHNKNFGFKNAKIIFLKKLRILYVVFIRLKFRWLQTILANLKNTKLLIVCLV